MNRDTAPAVDYRELYHRQVGRAAALASELQLTRARAEQDAARHKSFNDGVDHFLQDLCAVLEIRHGRSNFVLQGEILEAVVHLQDAVAVEPVPLEDAPVEGWPKS